MKIKDADIHDHLQARMRQRGITLDEIQGTLDKGWNAEDVRVGTYGKVYIFRYGKEWEGSTYEEKEVTVYYKIKVERMIILTAKARYGKNFDRGEKR